MKRVTIFCGSSEGTEEIFKETAYSLGQYLALQNIEIVFGFCRYAKPTLKNQKSNFLPTLNRNRNKKCKFTTQ